ncbi:MAG: S24 family peptidase [Methylophaga sp.]
MEKIDKYVCSRLKSERQRLKKTIREVAELCSVATKTVSRWEDDTPIPSDKLALLTEIDFDLLFVLKGERYRSDSESSDYPQRNTDSTKKTIGYGKSDRVMENGSLDPIHSPGIGSHNYGHSEFVSIPLYDVRASAGNGNLVDGEHKVDDLMFKREWIHNELHNNPANLSLIYIDGDSMEPSLRAGDIVLVDKTDKDAKRDGIYVIRMGAGLLVKRLQRLPGHRIKVISDNSSYEPFEISLEWNVSGEFDIIGRVVWSGRRH